MFYDLIIRSYFLRYNECVALRLSRAANSFEVFRYFASFIVSFHSFANRFVSFIRFRYVFTNDWRSLAPFMPFHGLAFSLASHSLIYRQNIIKRENLSTDFFNVAISDVQLSLASSIEILEFQDKRLYNIKIFTRLFYVDVVLVLKFTAETNYLIRNSLNSRKKTTFSVISSKQKTTTT